MVNRIKSGKPRDKTSLFVRKFQFGYKMFWVVILAKSASKYVC
ncbi:hypothetical protein BN000_00317 [Neobacillus massiliamazoniensis]|jgi:hypothetical protein|uniref:Uncharacterized protein n=1 Tax=Neobacillus massiliamazoniensis TaxID=1499688 RepID=A0A0U1NQY1_9BACI|nr:hypothetical protein BN000_00317 [Neobacillus massiliamazoniensis]